MPGIDRPQTPESPLISLAMIVKDGGQLFASLLDEARQWVDEMVIGDTGSTDSSIQIAQDRGAKVFTVPWTDDFAAARNTVLQECRGRWILILDADEQLSPQDWQDLTAWLRKQDQDEVVAISLVTRNYVPGHRCQRGWWRNPENDRHSLPQGPPTDGFVPSAKVRIFPGGHDIRFAGHLHETVETSLRNAGVPCVVKEWPVHHFGLLVEQRDPDQEKAKQQKYLKLARRKASADPHLACAWAELADCAVACGELDQALVAIDRALVLMPLNAEYRLVAAGILRDLDQLAKAEEHLVTAGNSGTLGDLIRAEIAHLLGQILMLQNKQAQAGPHLEQALCLAPTNGHYLNTLGAWHLQGGRGQKALAALEKAHALLPQAPDPLLNLGLLYQAAGRPETAEEMYRKALERDPGNAGAKKSLERLLSQQVG